MTTHKISRTCSIEGCEAKHAGRGYCAKHLARDIKYGDPLQLSPRYGRGLTHKERFWSKVDKTQGLGRDGDCWEWRGGVSGQNRPYGSFTIHYKHWRTHRLAYFWATGVMPTMDVLHSCDNPRCVNPDHLREGTTQDNTQDRHNKGRSARGEKHGQARLTAEIVRSMRKDADNGMTYMDIARKFQASHTHVAGIVKRKRWRHVK